MNNKYPKYNPETMTKKELIRLIKFIDNHSPRADKTCDKPGITLSEAAWRMMHYERNKQND